MKRIELADYRARHFLWAVEEHVATLTLHRPHRKNALTFETYGELRDLFQTLPHASDVQAVVLVGTGEDFCSGGDVHEIIGPLVQMAPPELLRFTQMTGDVVKAMLTCPQVVVAAVRGVCAGAGAALAMASDLRFGTKGTRVVFLFNRVGLAGCDMGACALLPRLVGHGRAAELLYTGRVMDGEEALRWGFFNRLCEPDEVFPSARELARTLAGGPTFAHAMTKRMLYQEWAMGLDEAIGAEAQAQALCMATQDFRRGYEAFVAKRAPIFRGDYQ